MKSDMLQIIKVFARLEFAIAAISLTIYGQVSGISNATAQTAETKKMPASVTFNYLLLYADESPTRMKVFAQGDFMRIEVYCTSSETPDIVEIIDHKNHKGL